MRAAPPELAARLADAAREERDALAAAKEARANWRRATSATAAAAAALRAAGLHLTEIALIVARERGLDRSVAVRRRLASCLQKRIARLRATLGRGEVRAASVGEQQAVIPSSRTQEANMRLLKRTTTREVYEVGDDEEDLDLLDQDADDLGNDDDAEDERDPPKRRRRR